MVEPFAMASSPATLIAIATALFVAVAVARPPTLSSSPSPCHPHPPCRLPPSSPPQSSPPPLPLLSLAPYPFPPHCLPPSLPPQSLPPPSPSLLLAPHPRLRRIALATAASAIVIARHPRHHRNRPLRRLCLHSPATLVAVAPPRVGDGRTIPTSGLLSAFV